MKLKQYVVDTFTGQLFKGNPAAVCLVKQWLSDDLMLSIAQENNLSETAFLLADDQGYQLRWFTPGGEIDLCGHATLASAYVVMNYIQPDLANVRFNTKSGILEVVRNADSFEMNFPAYPLQPMKVLADYTVALGETPKEVYLGRDLLCIYEQEETVRKLTPDLEKLKDLPGLLLHASSQGNQVDCVSRSFAPKLGVAEDPVCGSGHCHIVPYWAAKLGKSALTAYQASKRGGMLYCQLDGGRVILGGKAVLYSTADIEV